MTHRRPDDPGPGPSERLPWGQRLYRALFRVYGPAQVGPPPFASDAELQRYRAGLVPPASPAPSDAPPGYRIVRYRDDTGTVHNTLIRDDGTDRTEGADRTGQAPNDAATGRTGTTSD